MSVSLSFSAIIGIPVSEIFRVEQREKIVTKYDADTGKPYSKHETEYVGFLLGKEVPDIEPSPEEWEYDNRFPFKEVGLTFCGDGETEHYHDAKQVNPYHYYDYTKEYVGVELTTEDDENYSRLISLTATEYAEKVNLAIMRFASIGVTCEPRLYVSASLC